MLSIYLANIETDDDKRRFERLYHRYKEELAKMAVMYLGDEVMALDAVHTAYFKISQNFERVPHESDPSYERAYIYKVTKCCIVDEARKRNAEYNILDIDIEEVLSDEYAPDSALIRKEQFDKIMTVINNMPENVKDILIFRYVYGFSVLEISKTLGINPNTVKTRLRRGTAELRLNLTKEKSRKVVDHV